MNEPLRAGWRIHEGELVGGPRDGTRISMSPDLLSVVRIPVCMTLWNGGNTGTVCVDEGDDDENPMLADVPMEAWVRVGIRRSDGVAVYHRVTKAKP